MRNNHEIDYRIFGEEMQYVEIELDPNETAIAEPGAFMMMHDGIQLETIFGDGSQQQGGLLGKLFSAGKRMLVGEHASGFVQEIDLHQGELLKVDTGCIVGFTSTVDYDIQFVGGIKNTLFGGEGLFFATLRGPGRVWIQSLPVSRLAGRILAYGTYKRKEEGSVLGGLGNLLDGDGWK